MAVRLAGLRKNLTMAKWNDPSERLSRDALSLEFPIMAGSEPTMDFQAAWAALVARNAVRREHWTKDMLRVEITGDEFRGR